MKEYDFHGKTIDEVSFLFPLIILEDYNLKRHKIRIITGIGTGALRKTVLSIAEKSIYVEKIEFSHPNIGGAGSVEITFKKQVKS